MSGYIIELYKYICAGKNYSYEDIPEGENKSDHFQGDSYMTFGYFDKMAVSRVRAFSKMRDMSELSKKWIGERQTLLLYEINKENDLVYRTDQERSGFYVCTAGKMQRSQNLFIAVSVLQFMKSPDEEKQDISECMRSYREKILQLVESSQMPVCCSVMGILGTYGVAILWAADQYIEILSLIDQIRGGNFEKDTGGRENDFLSFFTIFAQNNMNEELKAQKMEKVDGKAILQITLQTDLNEDILQTFQCEFKPDEFLHSSGEYDLLIKADIKNLYKHFEKGDILHPKSDFYKKYILQTNVRLCEEKRFVKFGSGTAEKKETDEEKRITEQWKTYIEPAWETYSEVRKEFLEKFPKTAGMVDSLDLLYGDYVSKVSSVSNKMWAHDFLYQFKAILKVIIKSLKNISDNRTSISPRKILSDFRDILSCYEHQIIHIAESSNLVIDTPKCHLRYTGQNNLTLYAYFGFTKDIIELCYCLQENSKQSIILPLISADIVPIVESEMYIDYGNSNDDRVIKLNIPVTALYNIPEYMPYVYHEIFHYVVPEDRAVRNWIKGVFLITIGIRNAIAYLLSLHMSNYNEIKEEVENFITFVLTPYLYRSVYQRYYDSVIASVRGIDKKQRKTEVEEADVKNWRQYEQEMFSKLLSEISGDEYEMEQQSLIMCVMEDLYLQREKIKAEAGNLDDSLDKDAAEKCVEELMRIWRGIFHNNPGHDAKVQGMKASFKVGSHLPEAILNMDELETLSDSLSEVACDIPMVEIGKMDIVHYMLCYVKIQKDLLGNSKMHMRTQDRIRIGIVFDFLDEFQSSKTTESRMDIYEMRFTAAYVGLYYSLKKGDGKAEPGECLNQVKKEAEEWFSWIKRGYQEYIKEYRVFSPVFKELVSQISVKQRNENQNLRKEMVSVGEKAQDESKYENGKRLLNKLQGMEPCRYYEALNLYGEKILAIIQKNPNISREEFVEVIDQDKDRLDQQIFDMNIKYIQNYQKQSNFDEIEKKRDTYAPADKNYHIQSELLKGAMMKVQRLPEWEWVNEQRKRENYEYKVNGTLELFQIIEKISENFSRQNIEIYGNDRREIWYRGQSKSSHVLLPSAMRKYVDMRRNVDTLLEYQIDTYGEFKFRMDNSSERVEKAGYAVCDYLALMQHYGAPTIYMDWSENALWSLYFALEEYIDPKKKQERHMEDAALFMLHPNLYNEARDQLMKLVNPYANTPLNNNLHKTMQNNTNSLPNLSLEHNREKYYMFLLGSREESANDIANLTGQYTGLQDPNGKELLFYLPLAIYASRANARVRAQHGMFMAFNVLSPLSRSGDFKYMALEEIQDLYLETFKGSSPFMYKIVIRSNCKEEIANWLKTIGICKDMIYPELGNIGERI